MPRGDAPPRVEFAGQQVERAQPAELIERPGSADARQWRAAQTTRQ
ncbi:hypothetical protein Bsp3421_003186 [Burkholderia sp. FERM BP-3421]|jgi:hypothetical protein|nr:hypothetical protein [Burkholderia sp. FERM BP-3421]WDD93131.1 hypothetical protein Bsp3421_003186 [Burkholderia sp. FERM BP-3421]